MNKIILVVLFLSIAVLTPVQMCNAFFTRTYAKASAFFKYATHTFKAHRFGRHFSAPTHTYPPKNIAKQSFSRGFDDWEKYAHEDDEHMPCPRWVKMSAIFGVLYSFNAIGWRYMAWYNQQNKNPQSEINDQKTILALQRLHQYAPGHSATPFEEALAQSGKEVFKILVK